MTKILIEIYTDTQAVVPMDLMRRIEDYLSTERVSAGVSLYNDVLGVMMAAAPQPEQAQQSDGTVIDYGTMVSAEFLECFNHAFSFLANGHSIGQCFDMMKFARAELIKSMKTKTAPRPIPTSEQALVEALTQEFPLFDDDGLDETEHQCEWAMQQDRKRLHHILAMCSSHQPTGLTRPAEPRGGEAVRATDFLQEHDLAWLIRFCETAEDDNSYDTPKDALKRLLELGVVRSLGFGRCETTSFGDWLIEQHFEQSPSLPLKTAGETRANS